MTPVPSLPRSPWRREPLLHFAVLGVVLFALYRWVTPPVLTNRIVLSEAVVRGLRQDHLRRTGTLPTAEEETALLQRFVDTEILYREAIAEGLDRGDIIVRRRLVQKMEFLIEGEEAAAEPADADLQSYLDAHRDRYLEPERLTLAHVFACSDRHAGDLEGVAATWRKQLLAGVDPANLGDPFLRGREFRLHTPRELAGVFGDGFASQVQSLPIGAWSEPVRSSYGLHVVRVTEHTAAHLPTLAEIRTAVVRDWQEDQRAEAHRTALARLRRRYDVRVEGAAAPAGAAVAVSR